MLLDMPDGGAEHFAKTVCHLKERYIFNVWLSTKTLECGTTCRSKLPLAGLFQGPRKYKSLPLAYLCPFFFFFPCFSSFSYNAPKVFWIWMHFQFSPGLFQAKHWIISLTVQLVYQEMSTYFWGMFILEPWGWNTGFREQCHHITKEVGFLEREKQWSDCFMFSHNGCFYACGHTFLLSLAVPSSLSAPVPCMPFDSILVYPQI